MTIVRGSYAIRSGNIGFAPPILKKFPIMCRDRPRVGAYACISCAQGFDFERPS